jgi:ferric-dicitrate binding protein FerR (iron transport regulator)
VRDVGEERDRVEEFERAWKTWAERPARRSPEEAGRRTVEAARLRRRRSRAVRTLLATAALLVIAVTLGVRRQGPVREAPPPTTSVAAVAAPPLRAGQALIWLDAETPLYMTFEAPPAAPGGLP